MISRKSKIGNDKISETNATGTADNSIKLTSEISYEDVVGSAYVNQTEELERLIEEGDDEISSTAESEVEEDEIDYVTEDEIEDFSEDDEEKEVTPFPKATTPPPKPVYKGRKSIMRKDSPKRNSPLADLLYCSADEVEISEEHRKLIAKSFAENPVFYDNFDDVSENPDIESENGEEVCEDDENSEIDSISDSTAENEPVPASDNAQDSAVDESDIHKTQTTKHIKRKSDSKTKPDIRLSDSDTINALIKVEPDEGTKKRATEDGFKSVSKSAEGLEIFPASFDEPFIDFLLTDEEVDLAKAIAVETVLKIPGEELVRCKIIKLNNALGTLCKDDFDRPCCLWIGSRFDILKKIKDKSGKVYADILIKDDFGEKIVRVPVTTFQENKLSSLAQYNLLFHSEFTTQLSIYFNRLLSKLPMTDAQLSLGIVKDTENKDYIFNAYTQPDGFDSKMVYNSWSAYIQDFNELIAPRPALQYLVATSMSAPILTLLSKKHNLDLHSYSVNIVGASSTGKTISSRFCSALWTNPKSDKIFSAMLATSNASLKQLDGRYGIPTFLDEATILGGVNPAEFAYSVYEEREKKRLNSDCSVKHSGTWSTIVVMSSEQHFHANKKIQNGGMAVRVLSMENLQFTTDKEHADRLNEFIRENWGIVGRKFVKWLFKNSDESLVERYNNAKASISEYLSDSHNAFTDRLSAIYAVTYMTAEILSKMGMAIDVEAVAEIMAEHNRMVSSEQNIAENAMKAIYSFMVRNRLNPGIRVDCDTNERPVRIVIEESLLEEIFRKNGFTDVKVTIKEMDKAGMLLRQQEGRLKSKLSINGAVGYGYQFSAAGISEVAEQFNPLNKSSKKIQFI